MTPSGLMAPTRTIFKQAAKAGWLILSRTLALTAFGLILNWGLFAVLAFDIWGRYCPAGHFMTHTSSGLAAALALFLLALVCSRAVILTAAFMAVFPFLYFMAGKSRGLKSAVAYLSSDNRAWIQDLLKPVIQSVLNTLNTSSAEGTPGGRAQSVASFVSRRLDPIGDMPRPLRWLIKAILEKLKVAALIQEVNALKRNGEGDEAVIARIQSRIDQGIDEKMKVGWGGPALLVLANALFAATVYWLIRG